MSNDTLLGSYLRELRLPTFSQNHRSFATDPARVIHEHVRCLLALVAQGETQREQNHRQRRIKTARFPDLKELAGLDFSPLPTLNKTQVLDLARGEYITRCETIRLVGNPGLGKTHLAIGMGLATDRQAHRVRFWTTAGLVNDLLQTQKELRPREPPRICRLCD